MAIVKCSECGSEVSDKATTCPSCGAPICGIQIDKQEKRYSVRQGSITGLIGAASLPIILAVCYAISQATPEKENAVTISINPAKGSAIVILPAIIGLVIGLICFLIGTAFGNKLSRTISLLLSIISLIASLTLLISVFAGLNALLLCIGWIYGWEPILMTWGSIKMLKDSLRMPK